MALYLPAESLYSGTENGHPLAYHSFFYFFILKIHSEENFLDNKI